MVNRGAAAFLVRVLMAKHAGHDEVPPTVPPHLVDALWRFRCRCHHNPITVGTDSATVEQGRVVAPRRFCPSCRTWNRGEIVSR